MSEDQEPIVGIDLGTTNSVVAMVVDGQPRVLNDGDEALLPSVVGINPQGQLVTGVAERTQLAAVPDPTGAAIKRRKGRPAPVAVGDPNLTRTEIDAQRPPPLPHPHFHCPYPGSPRGTRQQ